MCELADMIVRLTWSSSRIVFKPRPTDDPQQRCPDIGMAHRELGWQPTIALEEGLRRTIDYFDALLRNPTRVNTSVRTQAPMHTPPRTATSILDDMALAGQRQNRKLASAPATLEKAPFSDERKVLRS